jgi:alpha-N-arabinofuranosidase
MFFLQSRKVYLVLSVVAGFVVSGSSQSTVTFNVTGATTVIPKEIFGVLMERLGRQWNGTGAIWVGTGSSIPNTNGMRTDVINGFIECGVGSAEWPGGCAANGYNWNPPNPSNDVGTDRFMQFCQLIGCEPVLCGPGYSTSASSNLAWVTYINNNSTHPEWNLKYFKIGNEVWGCGGSQSEATYESNYTANYNVLRNSINGKRPALIAGNACEGTWNWLPTMLSHLASSIDEVEFHDYNYYPGSIDCTNPTNADYWQMIYESNIGQIRPHLETNIIPYLDQYDPGKRIKMCIDEYGDWLSNLGDGWMQQNTVMNAVSAGEVLHVYTSHADRVQVVCLAQAVNVIHSLININTSLQFVKTPTFYVYKLLKPHHTNGAKLVPITASSIQTTTQTTRSSGSRTMPVLTTVASVDNHDTVNISFTNADLTATRSVTVTVTSSGTIGTYVVRSAQVVTGSALNSCNNFGAAESVNIQTLNATTYPYSIGGKALTLTLPSKSVVMFRLQPIYTAVQPGSFMQNGEDAFSIKAGSHGTVLITSSVSQKTPVTVGLYGVDGRTLIDRVSRTFEAGNSTCVLKSNRLGRGVYLVKIAGEDINLSKKVVVAR